MALPLGTYYWCTVQVRFLSPGFAFGHLLLMHSSSKSFQIISLVAKLFILNSTCKLVLKETITFNFKLMTHTFKCSEVKETDWMQGVFNSITILISLVWVLSSGIAFDYLGLRQQIKLISNNCKKLISNSFTSNLTCLTRICHPFMFPFIDWNIKTFSYFFKQLVNY